MTSPHHLHATAAAWSLQAACGRLTTLAAAEARQNAAGLVDAADGLRSTTYGQRHATGGHSDPVSGLLTAGHGPARVTLWADRIQTTERRLGGIADMYRLGGTGPALSRIHTALPTLRLGHRAMGLLALHLADEDELVRGWLAQPPYRDPIPGACPGCGQRRLEVTTVGAAHARTVVCAAGCRHTPGCPCPGGLDGVRHIWPRAQVLAPVSE